MLYDSTDKYYVYYIEGLKEVWQYLRKEKQYFYADFIRAILKTDHAILEKKDYEDVNNVSISGNTRERKNNVC